MTNDLKFTTAGDYMKMNKLIEELAAKANFGHMENNEVVYDPRLEKFAELIVQECAKVIFETQVDYIEIDVMHRIRDRVKNHFGVEECAK